MSTIRPFHNTSILSVRKRGTNAGGATRGMKEAASHPSSTAKINEDRNEWRRQHGHRLRQHRREGGGRDATAVHATAGSDEDDLIAAQAAAPASSGSGRRVLLAGCASLASGLSLGVEGEGSPTVFFGRGDVVGVVGVALPTLTPTPPAAQAADVASFVSLDALVAQVRAATSELTLIREALSTSVALGTEPPLKELKKRLTSGALADLPQAAVRLDRFIDNAPLEDWEDAVWSSVAEETRGSREIQSVTGKRLPGVERTNDFLCLVFSCFNGGRVERVSALKSRGAPIFFFNAPPHTDVLLSLKLLGDGVAMGLRGDERITSEGLTFSVDDVSEKLSAYVGIVESSRIVAKGLPAKKLERPSLSPPASGSKLQ